MVACPSEGGNEGTHCNKADRPLDTIACNIDPCPTWKTGGWSEVNTLLMSTVLIIYKKKYAMGFYIYFLLLIHLIS
jgi:hypothetical protein